MRDFASYERVVLGQMLTDPQAAQDAEALLTAEDFRLSANRLIFTAVLRMREAGIPVEPLALDQWFAERKQLDEVGGFAYLMQLSEESIRHLDIRHYAEQVLESSALRRIGLLCSEIAQEVAEEHPSSAALLARLETLGKGIVESLQPEEMTTAENLLPQVLDRIMRPESRQPPMSTGIDDLDRLTLGGIRAKELWILGGLPGRGKTTAARQIARAVASAGKPVDIFTIEMPEEDWAELDLCAVSGVPAWKIRRNCLDRDERTKLIDAGEAMSNWPMRYEDNGSLHLRKLIARARLSVAKRGTRLFVVDYVQRVKSDEKEVRHRIGGVAEALAEFAKESGAAVLLLSQLARRGDINIRPTMQDLKESGELEAHAHCVLLNYRPVNKDVSSATVEEFTGEDEIIVAKQRNGPLGSAKVTYDPELLVFGRRFA